MFIAYYTLVIPFLYTLYMNDIITSTFDSRLFITWDIIQTDNTFIHHYKTIYNIFYVVLFYCKN
uniref:Uncharacterized protein n=1 Tax=viral metagenome TaxID=1070528 RepID=A0A6C0F0E7_9ZZZZ